VERTEEVLEALENNKVPIWKKYALTVFEAAEYFNIGEKKLREIIRSNPRADYLLWNGNKALLKRELFEKEINQINVI
jgi:hypothetical protein